MRVRKTTFVLTIFSAGLLAASARADISVTSFTGDSTFQSLPFQKDFGAQARMGVTGNGGQAVKLIDGDGSLINETIKKWTSGTAYDFELKMTVASSVRTLTYSVGGTTLSTSSSQIQSGALTDLFVRTRETDSSNALVSGMNLAVGSLTATAPNNGPSGAGPNFAQYTRFQVGNALEQGFTLTGKITFNWTGTQPTNSNLLAEFKVGTVPVPEPSTFAIAGAGIVAMAVLGRRSTRRLG